MYDSAAAIRRVQVRDFSFFMFFPNGNNNTFQTQQTHLLLLSPIALSVPVLFYCYNCQLLIVCFAYCVFVFCFDCTVLAEPTTTSHWYLILSVILSILTRLIAFLSWRQRLVVLPDSPEQRKLRVISKCQLHALVTVATYS